MINLIKKIIISILFSLIVIPVTSVFATSGACSSHNGVSCSLSNASKSVICNDGWSDSSTSYSNLEECKNIKCDVNSVKAYEASKGLLGSSFGSAMTNQCQNHNSNLELQSIDNSVFYKNLNNYDTSVSSDDDFNADDYINSEMQKYCEEDLGENSLYNSSSNYCYCKKGYEPHGTPPKCEKIPTKTKEQICKEDLGLHGIVIEIQNDTDKFYCGCESGYQFSANPDTCTLAITIPANRVIQSDFTIKANDVCRETKGIFSIFDTTSGKCTCIDGYELINNACKHKEVTQPVVSKNTNTLPFNSEIEKPLTTSSISKNSSVNNSLISTSSTTTSSTQTPPQKVSWFRKFINWFK